MSFGFVDCRCEDVLVPVITLAWFAICRVRIDVRLDY
jgi:hypothetical protein